MEVNGTALGRFTAGKEPWHPFTRLMVGPRACLGRFGVEKNLVILAGSEPRIIQSLA